MSELDPMAQAIAGLAQLNVLADAVAGYRAKLIAGGISDEAADRMAEKYNEGLVEVLKAQMANIQRKTSGGGGVFTKHGR